MQYGPVLLFKAPHRSTDKCLVGLSSSKSNVYEASER